MTRFSSWVGFAPALLLLKGENPIGSVLGEGLSEWASPKGLSPLFAHLPCAKLSVSPIFAISPIFTI
jgi:hypothetical protein